MPPEETTNREVSSHVWTPGDGQQARAEGWDLFWVRGGVNNGRNQIQRIDCPEDEGSGETLDPVFSSDEAVIRHLQGRADPLARKALVMDGAPHVLGQPAPSESKIRTLIAVIEVQESQRAEDRYLPTRSTMASCIEGWGGDGNPSDPWSVTDVTVYGSFEDLAASVQEGDPDLTTLHHCRPDQDGDDGIWEKEPT